MSSTRAKPPLDEQSFQGLLAAAFTIQEHNDRQQERSPNPPVQPKPRPDPVTEELCVHCGAPLTTDRDPCPRCGREKLRPGERLQRTWASMWLMSQEQGLWPPKPHTTPETDSRPLPSKSRTNGNDSANSTRAPLPPITRAELSGAPRSHGEASEFGSRRVPDVRPSTHNAALDSTQTQIEWPSETAEDSQMTVQPVTLFAHDHSVHDDGTHGDGPPDDSAFGDFPVGDVAVASSLRARLSDLRLRLNSHRADLYLGLALFIAALALLWPTGAPSQPTLHPWERMLVAMGLAEVAPPPAHYRGDPDIKVWVDTHTALYYCPGEELYGKSPDGHYSTQREAQSDRFEPAERSACVE